LQRCYTPNFVVHDLLVVNLRIVRTGELEEEAQLRNYLKATGYPWGLLLSFGFPGRLRWKSVNP
jgi:GxxExxY protein